MKNLLWSFAGISVPMIAIGAFNNHGMVFIGGALVFSNVLGYIQARWEAYHE